MRVIKLLLISFITIIILSSCAKNMKEDKDVILNINENLPLINSSDYLTRFCIEEIFFDEEDLCEGTNYINEFGFNLSSFCDNNELGLEMDILENSKIFGLRETAPTKFTVSFGTQSIEFNGVAYRCSTNGDPITEFIAGEFGEIRAKFIKSNINFTDSVSILHMFDALGINYTLYDDKSIFIDKDM